MANSETINQRIRELELQSAEDEKNLKKGILNREAFKQSKLKIEKEINSLQTQLQQIR